MLNYKVTAAISDSVDSPFTGPVNASGPTATDGTEFSAELLTQTWGAFQALLAASGFAPSGTADVADASETLDAIVEQAQGRAIFVKESGGSAADAYLVIANTSLTPQGTSTGANGSAHSYFAGMVLIFDIVAPNTGTSTVNAFGLGVQFIKTPDGNNVIAGDLSGRLKLRYDGTNFIVLESGGSSLFATVKADTILGQFLGEVASAGFLINNGYKEDIPAAGDLTIRPFSCDVAGTPIVKTTDTELDQALADISVSGWYAITVDQAGTLAVLGSPATPLIGANTVRPTGGGSTGAFGFDKFREDLQGYYFDATTRIIAALWIDEATDSVLYDIKLASGSDEVGNNSVGNWSVINSEAFVRQQGAAVTGGDWLANGVVYRGIKTVTFPFAFKVTPSDNNITVGCKNITATPSSWAGNVSSVTTVDLELTIFAGAAGGNASGTVHIIGVPGWF